MHSRRITAWVVAVLMVCGAVLVGLRFHSRYGVRMMQGDSTWRLTYHVSFQAPKAGLRLRVAAPSDAPRSRVYRQDLWYSGLNTVRLRPTRADTRELNMVTQRGGDFRLTARFDVLLSPHAPFDPRIAPGKLSAEDRAHYLRSTPSMQADRPAVVQVLEQLRLDPAKKTELLKRLYQYCHEEIRGGAVDAPSDAAGAIEKRAATPLGRARAMVALCRAAKLPARLVAGFEVLEKTEARPHVWVEVLTNDHWESYDPENGFAGEMPHNFLPARRDGSEIVVAPNVLGLRASYSVTPIASRRGIASRDPRPVDILDLTRLPVEQREILEIILLMPLGALVTAAFRTLIGIRTYGTFTPTLLALSFVFNDWRAGLVVLFLAVGLGLATRSFLDRLKLLMVPRLSVVLTLIALCIIFVVSLLDYLEITRSANAVLLPMVIMTMTVERFYLTTEEDGLRFALQLMGGTLIVSACCYLVLRWEEVGRLLLIYPELHFFTVGILILMGRYTGYRLTELWRFRDIEAEKPD